MQTLKITVLAGTLVAFAVPALAGPGGCGSADHKTAQTQKPTTTATAPITPKPSGTGG